MGLTLNLGKFKEVKKKGILSVFNISLDKGTKLVVSWSEQDPL